MWTQLAAGISDAQRKQLVEDAAKALQNLPLDELRDSNRLALKAQQQLARLISGMAVAVPAEEIHVLVHQVVARLGGLGFFHDLLPPQRSDLSEIAVTPDGTVWILKKGAPRFEALPIRPPRGEVWRGVEALLAPLGRAVNEATPSVDAKLPRGKQFSGARIKVLHPCIVPGEGFPSVNIRLYEAKPVTPDQLIAWGMAPEPVIRSLVETVGRGARLLIVGGTATGKTTFLSGISAGIPRAERVVKIEDPEEIWIDHPHVVTIEARPAPPGSSIPPYTVRNGVDDAMRMSPRWLIVGEVR
ncbi:MAG: ATPase, T2SS/T4P/T4SS family, partial [Anaerolineales bacterium]